MKMTWKLLMACLIVGVSFAGVRAENIPAKGEVNHRLRRQRKRVRQGVKSGQLTKDEAHNLRANDREIHKEEHADRAANGGKLTPGEKKQLNQELNENSRDIYQQKHDSQTR